MDKRGEGERSNSGEGPEPRRKPSFLERFYNGCFPRLRDELRGDQANHGEAAQDKISIEQLVDGDLKKLKETSGQTDRLLLEIGTACGELRKYNNADLSQLAANIVKVSDNISEEIGRSSLKLQGDYKELKKNVNKLETLGRGQGVQKQIEKEMGKLFVSLQKDCKELRNDNSKLETLRDFLHLWKEFNEAQTQLKADLGGATDNNITCINGLSQEVINRIKENLLNNSENDIEKIIGNPREFQKARDELKEAVDQLEALRSFNKMQTKIDANHIEGKNDENTRIDQLSNKIVEKFKKNLEPSDKQGIWNALKEAKTLWKVSHAWKQAHEVKAGYIDPLSEGNELKCYADIHIEDIDRQFRLFLSSFEQEYAESSASNCNAINCEELKHLQGGIEGNCKELKLRVLNDKWKKLVESRKNILKNQEDPTTSELSETEKKVLENRCGSSQSLYRRFSDVPHSLLYDQLSLAWENCDDAKAKKILVSHMAENIIHSYEFKDKTAKPSRRKQMWYGCKELFGKGQGECRSERVKRIADGFNKTLEDMKGKFAAADYLPKELKRKVLENIVTIMKDFEESCDAALRDYGKFKGGKAREAGEDKIRKLNNRIQEINEYLLMWRDVTNLQTTIKDAPSSSSSDQIPSLEQSVASKLVSQFNEAPHMQFLDCCDQLDNNQPIFENAHNSIKNENDKIKILSDCLKMWIQVKEPTTGYDQSRVDGARDIYKRVLEQCQQPGETPENLRGLAESLRQICNIDSYTKNAIIKVKDDGKCDIDKEIDINIENFINLKKGDFEGIASATTASHNPNEDSSFIFEGGAGVCDGVSGSPDGANASRITTQFFKLELPKLLDKVKKGQILEEQIKNELKKIALDAHDKVKNESKGGLTTLSAVISIGKGKMAAVNVGDSRVYVLRKGGQLEHKTIDDGPLSCPKSKFIDSVLTRGKPYPLLSVLVNGIRGNKLSEAEQIAIQEKIGKMEDSEIRELKEKIGLICQNILEKWNSDHRVELSSISQTEVNDQGISLEDIKMDFAIRHGFGINNALGDVNDPKPHAVTFDVEPGDMVIVTSDGMHDNLLNEDIIKCALGKTAECAAESLVSTAVEKSQDKTRSWRKPGDDTSVSVMIVSREGRGDAGRGAGQLSQ